MPPVLVVDDASVSRGHHLILNDLSLGVQEGDRIGVVGRNGGGKSTLLHLLAGALLPDSGRVTVPGGTSRALVAQDDRLPAGSVGDAIFGSSAIHEWAADPLTRDVLTGLLGGVSAELLPEGLLTRTEGLSGGQARRVALAAALVRRPDLLLLDEPTNHLDVEAIDWLARFIGRLPARIGVVAVTHDRWFLDAVSTLTWEVGRGTVEAYEGGYAAYVLARAERDRQASASEARRRNLLRKELAWLRRGPPARTSKPKFRMDAARDLISDEPPPRDRLSLRSVASARLGKVVVECEDLTLRPAPEVAPVVRNATWGLGPGDRIGLLGRNGVGKSTLIRLLEGSDVPPYEGRVVRGKTVRAQVLDQRLPDTDDDDRVLPWLERVGRRVVVSSGDELTASQLLEEFGFRGDAGWKRLGDLSGGEKRRLHLLRILLSGANLLLLDEPTNDLDVDTLTVLEDLLDRWPGTLLVVSHDRYFLERVCDDMWEMPGDGTIRHLPGGVDQYLRESAASAAPGSARPAVPVPPAGDRREPSDQRSAAAAQRERRKESARAERVMERAQATVDALHRQMADHATDPDRLVELGRDLRRAEEELVAAEDAWLTLVQ